MQEPIEQILKMVEAGRITSAQAATMIAELNARATPGRAAPAPAPAPAKRGFWSHFGLSSHTQGVYASELQDNDLSLSSVDIDHGEGQVFRGNHMSMSSLARVSLVRSEMTENTLGASSMQDIQLEDAHFTGCDLQKSSIDGLTLKGARLEELSCSASSLEKLSAGADSRLRRLRLTASQMKGLSLDEGAQWHASEVVGAQITDLRLRGSSLEGFDLQAVQMTDLELTRCRLDSTIVRSLRLKKIRMVDCVWSDVLLSGGDTWKRSGFEDVSFEGCKLSRALLSECRLTRVTFRNLDLSEVKAHRVELADQIIDGNEAFLAAIGPKSASH